MDDSEALKSWRAAVRQALHRGDSQELATLFSGAQDTWGKELTSRMWLEEVSGFDANAVTG